MSQKVNYLDHLDQGEVSVLARDAHSRTPLEELMLKEEGPPAELNRAWVVEVFLEMVFADEMPMDWRYAGRRGLCLLRSFSPGLLAGRSMAEAGEFAGLAGRGRFAQDDLVDAAGGREEELREMLNALLRWVYEVDGPRWMEKGTWKLYVLASRYHSRALQVWEEAKTRRKKNKLKDKDGRLVRDAAGAVVVEWAETDLPGRYRDMGYADFAEAFGEGRDDAARARWCYRAGRILKGIPQVPGSKTQEAKEKMSVAAMGNRNRKKVLSEQ